MLGESATGAYRTFLVLGGGSAGFLSALTLKQAFPAAEVTLIRSTAKGVIGVGESTTRAVPIFLHGVLKLPRGEFYREVRPVWKLGNRLEWGPAEISHFNYPFDAWLISKSPSLQKANLYYGLLDLSHGGLYSSLMDQCRSPILENSGRLSINELFGYHIDNRLFLAYVEKVARQRGVVVVDGEFAGAPRRDDGDLAAIHLSDGRVLTADFFVDCSGFASLLLGKALGEPYRSYGDALHCDRALVGSWDRGSDEPLKPYTITEAMEHGWCWNIGFYDHVNRGYVYASEFCSDEQARSEFQQKNPKLGNDLRIIKFPSGRYERFWVGNVAAVGNAAAFAEPMESTALQLITEQLRYLCKTLLDCSGERPPPKMIELENRRSAQRVDDVRDFLSIHYKFNTRFDTPFWRHCRETVEVGAAQEFVEYYEEVGPSLLATALAPEPSIFGFEGYMTLLLGQRVPTRRPPRLDAAQVAAWREHQQAVRAQAAAALSMDQATRLVADPQFRWAAEGV